MSKKGAKNRMPYHTPMLIQSNQSMILCGKINGNKPLNNNLNIIVRKRLLNTLIDGSP